MDTAAGWSRCLTLAWESFCARTTPVGAVVLAPDGTIVAEGRGRRFEPPIADRQLAHSRIAHAEINALAVLPPTRSYGDHVLLTTLEPCCMCLGAAIQSTITSLHYAAPDPYGGSAHLAIDTPQARRRPLSPYGPLHDERGAFAEQLHLVWLLDAAAPDAVLQPHRTVRPDAYAAAVRARSRLTDLRASHAPLPAAMDSRRT
ncbi:MAG TPA: nucleoside deaminase [Mycobacteriales bacterium]|nr:nucleoside deaminase [Mycobacteriales bacterium]